jgi:hypothetical protein
VESQMNRERASRPSLRITRAQSVPANCFRFDVWSPFTGSYQPVSSIEEGIRRTEQLAALICQMWLHRHLKRNLLVDAPDRWGKGVDDRADPNAWAELRINATLQRSYDTRRFDRLIWVRVAGISEAIATTCATVGCAPPAPA